MRSAVGLLLAVGVVVVHAEAAEPKIPAIHSTDLFHPHGDPDDHYDLATAFAIEEFDLKGVILDLGEQQSKRSGKRAVEQMNRITGRNVPCAVGLSRKFHSRTDTGLDEPAQFQGGVEMILSVLRGSKEKVLITTTGSCRDVAAAFNRQPQLLKEKVRAVYINIGRGPGESQQECNVNYDALSYLRMFESGLPLYWCPCFGKNGYATLYRCDQTAVVDACTAPVRNFFVYCLARSQADPIAFLTSGQHPLPSGGRNMWCTAPMFHAAGRKIYQSGKDDYFQFYAVGKHQVQIVYEDGASQSATFDVPDVTPWELQVELQPKTSNGFVFRTEHPQYQQVLSSCLKNLLAGLGR